MIVKPLVSILVPAYNAERWIGEAVRSALEQTWERKEIIVVNDGSTDGTVEALRPFEAKGVCVVTQKNQGAAAARNKAFSVCNGDYVQWLDADDSMSPVKIESQLDAANKLGNKRILLSGAWGRFMYRRTNARFSPTALWADLTPAEWLIRKLSQNLFMQTATWLVSREMTEAAGPWDTQLLGDDDGEYFCRVLLQSQGVHFVPNAKVYYRDSGTSSLSYIGYSERKMIAQLRSMKLHAGYMRSLADDDRAHAALSTYFQNWSIFFYPERLDLFQEIAEMSREVGGTLKPPSLSWKYLWIKALFGWNAAKRAQILLPRIRWSTVRSYDRFMARIERRRPL